MQKDRKGVDVSLGAEWHTEIARYDGTRITPTELIEQWLARYMYLVEQIWLSDGFPARDKIAEMVKDAGGSEVEHILWNYRHLSQIQQAALIHLVEEIMADATADD